MSILIKGMEMPKSCYDCELAFQDQDSEHNTHWLCGITHKTASMWERLPDCPLISISVPHGRLIDADALIADLKRQCKEVFKTDAVSPDDFWITRNEAYNERLWTTWCESLYDYINTAPTVIPEEGEPDDKNRNS